MQGDTRRSVERRFRFRLAPGVKQRLAASAACASKQQPTYSDLRSR
jgi:hypothetical protein